MPDHTIIQNSSSFPPNSVIDKAGGDPSSSMVGGDKIVPTYTKCGILNKDCTYYTAATDPHKTNNCPYITCDSNTADSNAACKTICDSFYNTDSDKAHLNSFLNQCEKIKTYFNLPDDSNSENITACVSDKQTPSSLTGVGEGTPSCKIAKGSNPIDNLLTKYCTEVASENTGDTGAKDKCMASVPKFAQSCLVVSDGAIFSTSAEKCGKPTDCNDKCIAAAQIAPANAYNFLSPVNSVNPDNKLPAYDPLCCTTSTTTDPANCPIEIL